ncbi:MAG: RNA-directed DNA polymerase [Planctomycetes bacterium]|nr:RNA-directed DNA polymerase [Planctomycetota bacterium]
MSTRHSIARNLAAAFLTGTWSLDGLVQQGARACGKRERWLRPLARCVLAAFPGPPAGIDPEALARWMEENPVFRTAWAKYGREGRFPLGQVFWVPPRMTPRTGAPATWRVPPLTTSGALAEWLGLKPKELDWFADCHGGEEKLPPGPLRHYTYRWLVGRSRKLRLLEMPKQRLKALQRRVLHDLLDHLPCHEAAHGYRRGRSVATYVGPHTGRRIVLHLDLRDFFPSIRSSRVQALFRTVGYPFPVARLLTGLCTNVVPGEVWHSSPVRGEPGEWNRSPHYQVPHLPQGAPTSPALANLCAYRLDCRLTGLARAVGAAYTRYADDLAFSGGRDLERSTRGFQVQVARIALEEGFEVHTRKTRFMRQGVRQQLAGVVLNEHANLRREEYDRLKAILFNCVRHGPGLQNREGRPDFRESLAGRIAYVQMLNPSRGRRLRELFDRIAWEK